MIGPQGFLFELPCGSHVQLWGEVFVEGSLVEVGQGSHGQCGGGVLEDNDVGGEVVHVMCGEVVIVTLDA